MPNTIPMYVFTGFLESGKTKFIQETLEDERFNAGEKTLLLVFEEGEEEYDISTYPSQNVYIETLDYEGLSEEKLENLLENAEGVGKVKVMLMEEGGQGVYSAGETEVTGVLIVAEGADNAVTVQKIQQAVMALFQIDAHKIRIIKMK